MRPWVRARDRNGGESAAGAGGVAPDPFQAHLTLEAIAARGQFYLSLSELRRRYREPRPEPHEADELRRTPLTASELKVFSQNGEDGVIAELLRRIGIDGPGWFVEIGAGDGREATCLALADVLGWRGVLVEADTSRFQRLQRKYEARADVLTLHDEVTPDNVDAILARTAVPSEIDVLAIDVDGRDYWIWRALERLAPRLVVVEYNARLGRGESLTIPVDEDSPWDGTDYFGASLTAWEHLAESRGLRLVHTDQTGTNAFFLRRDLAGFCPDPEVVPVAPPNYLLAGLSHRPDPRQRPFVTPPQPRMGPQGDAA